MKRTAASSELECLDPFVGIWDTEGRVMNGPAGEPVKFKATDTFEWLPGGHFLFHRFEANLPEGPLVGIEIIGYDTQRSAYTMYAFDSLGSANIMEGHYEMDSWTFIGNSMLFSGGFRDQGKVFAGLWERRSADGHDWLPWMELTLHKVE